MKNITLIVGILLSSRICYGATNQCDKSSFLQLFYSSITALPERYHTLEYCKVYSLFAASFEKQNSLAMVQFYKHCVYNEDLLKRWPKELVWHLFAYLKPSFFIISLKNLAESVNASTIRKNFIKNLLPSHFSSFDVVPLQVAREDTEWIDNYFKGHLFPFSFEGADCKKWIIRIKKSPDYHDPITQDDIQQLKKTGLLPKTGSFFHNLKEIDDIGELSLDFNSTYNQFKSFNNHNYITYIYNRGADFHIEYSQLRSEKKVEYVCQFSFVKNSIIICDSKNGDMVVGSFKFDDYIRACFCSGDFLIVELIDEILEQSDKNPEPTHKKGAQFPHNHRIEIYNLESKEKLYGIGLPLVKPYAFNIFSYSLFFVDCDNIYLYDHGRNCYVSLPYKNGSVEKLMNSSNDFYYPIVRDPNTKQYLKYLSNKEALFNKFLQKNKFKYCTQFVMLVVLIGLLTQYSCIISPIM